MGDLVKDKESGLEIENVFVNPITGEPIEDKKFKIGDILVKDDKTIMGIYSGECVSEDRSELWPSFFIAFDCGKFVENFDDYDEFEGDWMEDYHSATDEEEEEFLVALEATTGLTWDFNTNTLVPLEGGSDWKVKGQVYPNTWAAGVNYDMDEICSFEDNCYFSKEFTAIRALAQLRILRDIYMKKLEIQKGEVAYAIVVDQNNRVLIRPYQFGVRNSILTFKTETQIRDFLTKFEDLVVEAAELLK